MVLGTTANCKVNTYNSFDNLDLNFWTFFPHYVPVKARTFILCACGIALAQTITAATFTVTNTADSGLGSLRQAILDSNVTTGPNTISFSIPSTDPNCTPTTHVCTISPTTAPAGSPVTSARQSPASSTICWLYPHSAICGRSSTTSVADTGPISSGK